MPAGLVAGLRRRHAEPQRAYHGWSHIEALLALFAEVQDRLYDPKAVLYAILFHDAVYDPTRSDNEERSADLLRALDPGLLDEATKAKAVRMVESTKGHALPEGPSHEEAADTAVFLDMDLSILAAEPERFDAYEREVRIEYAHVSDELFRHGRARILRDFLQREQLFLSDWGRQRFEAPARENLRRSLAALTSNA